MFTKYIIPVNREILVLKHKANLSNREKRILFNHSSRVKLAFEGLYPHPTLISEILREAYLAVEDIKYLLQRTNLTPVLINKFFLEIPPNRLPKFQKAFSEISKTPITGFRKRPVIVPLPEFFLETLATPDFYRVKDLEVYVDQIQEDIINLEEITQNTSFSTEEFVRNFPSLCLLGYKDIFPENFEDTEPNYSFINVLDKDRCLSENKTKRFVLAVYQSVLEKTKSFYVLNNDHFLEKKESIDHINSHLEIAELLTKDYEEEPFLDSLKELGKIDKHLFYSFNYKQLLI